MLTWWVLTVVVIDGQVDQQLPQQNGYQTELDMYHFQEYNANEFDQK